MVNPIHSLIRIIAFMNKEIVEITNQPRLLVTLILGPFLILFLFGIGYRNEGRPLRTIFVVEQNDPIANAIKQYIPQFEPGIIFLGITHNFDEAAKRLRSGEIDLVVKAPAQAYETIRSNQQAAFGLYHNEIDPYQADYIEFTGELYIDKLNRLILGTLFKDATAAISPFRRDLKTSKNTLDNLRVALDQGNWEEAERHKLKLIQDLKNLQTRLSSEAKSIQAQTGIPSDEQMNEFLKTIDSFRHQVQSDPPKAVREDSREASRGAAWMQEQLALIESRWKEMEALDSRVLFSPFRSTTRGLVRPEPNLSEYFTPSVIILLLQHLAVTFSALSIVREFKIGTVELFRISPLLPGELLIGKYLGYFFIGALVTSILTILLVHVLHVPMLGTWLNYALVIGALLFASLGVGFILSLLAQTESQAVQYSMILLLLSIFFTGFLLNLKMLWEPVRIVSWGLPATYGIQVLQNVMLRGREPDLGLLGVLLLAGVLFFALASRLLQRRMSHT